MSEILIVDVDVPRPLSFKGRIKGLVPGENEVDKALFLEVWAVDPVMRAMYADRAFMLFDADGEAPFVPPDATRQARRMPVATKGITHAAVPTSEMKPPDKGAEGAVDGNAEPPANTGDEPIEPTPMGGGKVPGNTNQAKATIMATSDKDRVSSWLENETRSTVRAALEKRAGELS